ncbi:MAG: phosphoribosyltransferase family protein [Pseudomonadota bacterium]
MTHPQRFLDRTQAGLALAARLAAYAGRDDVIVLALPRGGVPVGVAIAAALHVAFDVLVVRKLGLPWQPELAMGAVAGGGLRVLEPEVVGALRLEPAVIEAATVLALAEVARRERRYRGGRPPPCLDGRVVLLVDDGVATGATMRVAVQMARQAGAAKIVAAVPVCPRETLPVVRAQVDHCICLRTPHPFGAVGMWYEHFEQLSDEQVEQLIAGRLDAGVGHRPRVGHHGRRRADARR